MCGWPVLRKVPVSYPVQAPPPRPDYEHAAAAPSKMPEWRHGEQSDNLDTRTDDFMVLRHDTNGIAVEFRTTSAHLHSRLSDVHPDSPLIRSIRTALATAMETIDQLLANNEPADGQTARS